MIRILISGKPALALRHQFPLPVVEEVNLEEQNFENDKIEVPSFKFDPQTLGYVKQHRHGTTIPGRLLKVSSKLN